MSDVPRVNPPGWPWSGFDQLDFTVGAEAFVSPVCVPPPVATLLALPIVLIGSGSIGTSATGYGLGRTKSWVCRAPWSSTD